MKIDFYKLLYTLHSLKSCRNMISAFKGLHISVKTTVQGMIIIKKFIDTHEIKSVPIRPST